MAEIQGNAEERISLPIGEFARVLGGGVVPGSIVLVGGDPGIGKSTLLLQMALEMAGDHSARKVLYVSGEESERQIKMRALRLTRQPGEKSAGFSDDLLLLTETNLEAILEQIGALKPDLLIVDSIQTVYLPEMSLTAGSVSQVRECANRLRELAKSSGMAVFLVGHVTKEGVIAGPRVLEHIVDTVLYLEGDRQLQARLLRVLKNRFGPSDELVVFTMREQGLEIVDDPSTFFLSARDASLPGTAVALAVDGQRPFAVEIQALAAKTYLAIPRRTALGFDTNRLNLLLAVMEKRLKLNLAQFDLYAKTGGGLALRDPGLDLAVVAAVLSSFYDRPLPENAVFWGEVDLNGQIRPAPGHEVRLRQAKRLGYQAVHADNCKTLQDMQRRLFGNA